MKRVTSSDYQKKNRNQNSVKNLKKKVDNQLIEDKKQDVPNAVDFNEDVIRSQTTYNFREKYD